MKCTYPQCKCPFDMGQDEKCLIGHTRNKEEIMKCSTCRGVGLLDHGLCDYPCEDCSGTGDSSKKKQAVKEDIILDQKALDVISTVSQTALNIVNMVDDKRIQEMASYIADQLISLTNPKDL